MSHNKKYANAQLENITLAEGEEVADPFWATPRGRFDSFENQDKPEIFGLGLGDIVNYLKKMMEQGFRTPYCLGRIGRLAFETYWEEHRAHPALH